MGRKRYNASILLTDRSREGTIPEPGAGAGGILVEQFSDPGEAAAPLMAQFDIVPLGVIPGVQPPVCLSSHPFCGLAGFPNTSFLPKPPRMHFVCL